MSLAALTALTSARTWKHLFPAIGGDQPGWPFRGEVRPALALRARVIVVLSSAFPGAVPKDHLIHCPAGRSCSDSHPGHLSTRVLLLPSATCLILNTVRNYGPRAAWKYKGCSTKLRRPIGQEIFMRMLSCYEIRSQTESPSGAPAKMNTRSPRLQGTGGSHDIY
jgi:hypothetical protein